MGNFDTVDAAMSIGGNGNGCSYEQGTFAIREAVYAIDGAVENLAIDLRYLCDEDGTPRRSASG